VPFDATASLTRSPAVNATDSLRRDHDLIRRMLVVLGAIADRTAAGLPFPSAAAATVLEFLREFAEHHHHRKESDLLFPALALHQSSDEAAERVGEVLRDHDETRELLYTLTLFWEPSGLLTAAERVGFAEVARTYRQRLLRHLDAEESSIFPLADALLPDEEQWDVARQLESRDYGAGRAAAWQVELAALERDQLGE
jgi:hemerythrin-like domain-containing protein